MKTNTKKIALAGVLCAVAVVGSMFSFPVFGSKCAPVQHMVNVLCAVLLGPWYGVAVAFVASLLRNLLGLGSLMAFPLGQRILVAYLFLSPKNKSRVRWAALQKKTILSPSYGGMIHIRSKGRSAALPLSRVSGSPVLYQVWYTFGAGLSRGACFFAAAAV